MPYHAMNELNNLNQSLKKLQSLNREYTYFNEKELSIEIHPLNHEEKVFFLHHLNAIKISGSDAKIFLQGQFTSDLNQTPFGPISCYLSRKGRIISIFYISLYKDDYYLIMPADIIEIFTKQLKKYVFMSKVSIKLIDSPIISISNTLKNVAGLLANTPQVKLSDEALLVANDEVLKQINDQQPTVNIQGSWAWQKKQMQQKIPSIHPETIAKFLMHDINLHQTKAVDFTKGCFIGQEIVARMQYKSKIEYQVEVMSLASSIETKLNTPIILKNQKKGTIVDVLSNNSDEKLCLISCKI